ncbi:hypothetical protein GCM10009754_70410 [Amycolatopsis minnesotensis]|uniref:Uncharacterized protein n=1 Tax=Amycolatopsis minnesotensis TaxID=337894 RepID=A0ABN2SAD0_9PSEU
MLRMTEPDSNDININTRRAVLQHMSTEVDSPDLPPERREEAAEEFRRLPAPGHED